ncbi:GNAT family N-acetyltransferase [Nocardia alni]|uniref:GNAT family N-acetyltransferase n=1 Tax=Nocardia alni TaxID=2815723 RepID=UPI001C24F420|nr:GNAT family N-acetyltransferase [Nocardia alni]
MRIESTTDAALFQRRTVDFLSRDPLRHTVIATLLERYVSGLVADAALFVSMHADGAVVGVGLRTPGRPFHLGDMPHAVISGLVRFLSTKTPDLPGVAGVPDAALAFARQWQVVQGKAFRHDGLERLYRLGELRIPTVSGAAHVAVDADADLCAQWSDVMQQETGIGMDPGSVAARIALGRWWLWTDGDRPVAMAGHQERAFGWTRTGPVYTPPEYRSHGYASALTAHISKTLRAEGSQVCLFTDLANATSNKIYQAIGYEPVRDFVTYEFD